MAFFHPDDTSPREAWKRALNGFANKRREKDAERAANYARIVAEDQATIACEKAKRAVEQQVLDRQLKKEMGGRALAPEGSSRKLPGQAHD